MSEIKTARKQFLNEIKLREVKEKRMVHYLYKFRLHPGDVKVVQELVSALWGSRLLEINLEDSYGY